MIVGDRFYGTSDEFEEEQSKIKKSGEMVSKSKIEKSVNQLVQPIQYWLLEDVEFRLCNARGFTRNGCSTYSTPTILIIKHVTKNRSIDISILFKSNGQRHIFIFTSSSLLRLALICLRCLDSGDSWERPHMNLEIEKRR